MSFIFLHSLGSRLIDGCRIRWVGVFSDTFKIPLPFRLTISSEVGRSP